MSAWHPLQRFVFLVAFLSLVCWLPLGPWTANDTPAIGGTTVSEGAVKQTDKYPLHVLILRHAEKPDDAKDPDLSSRGAARAAALPSLFLAPPTFRTKPAPFPTPDFIFAAEKSKESNRPVETVTPLTKALGDMPIHAKHKDDDFQAVADEIFGDKKYAGKTILICWHHGKIPKLAVTILDKAKNGNKVKDQLPKPWDDAVFDRIWQITFDDAGKATFADRPQRLLFEDCAK
jgi:hypothetical protein